MLLGVKVGQREMMGNIRVQSARYWKHHAPTGDWGVHLTVAAGIYALLCLAWFAYQWDSPSGHVVLNSLLFLPIKLATAVLAWRASTHPALSPSTRRSWRVLGVSYLLLWLGNVLTLNNLVSGQVQASFTIGDALHLCCYPIWLWALVSFPMEAQSRAERLTFWLDAGMVLVGGGMLFWYFVFRPISLTAPYDLAATLLALVYPLGDLVLLFGVASFLLRKPSARSRQALTILGLSLLVFVIGDLGYGHLALEKAYRRGDWPDLFWMVGQFFMVLAAQAQYWYASKTPPAASDQKRSLRFSVLPYGGLVVGYGLLLHVSRTMQSDLLGGALLGAVTLTGLVAARQFFAVRENIRLLEERAAHQSEARFRSLVQNSSDVITIIESDGTIRYQTPSVEQVWGYERSSLIGRKLADLLHPQDLPSALGFFAEVAAAPGTTAPVEWYLQRSDGSWLDIETIGNNLLHDPNVGGLVLTSRNISERKQLQKQLLHQAFHDPLSKLPNRALFMERLERALARAQEKSGKVAVIFLDLDNFKVINDSLGHQVGDELLSAAAHRIKGCVRPGDMTARLGGDEFTVLLEDVTSPEAAVKVAQRIHAQLQAPFLMDGHEVFVTPSIGITLSTDENANPDSLLRDADVAMYWAKTHGKACYAVFDQHMSSQARERLSLETDLRHAVARQELVVYYQPIVDLQTGAIREVEALVRWKHPTRGLVSPADFIPLAEETGLILQVGQYVLEQACWQVRLWQQELPSDRPLILSVNLSARQFQHSSLLDDISATLTATGIDPTCLKLEITESVMMHNAESTIRTLNQLQALGMQLAVDDFGTGYSSLGYLKRFPLNTLKIDRTFTDGLGHDPEDTAIVCAIISLARALNQVVTAEGIETEAQLAHLRELGCEQGQGYLFSKPLPAAEMRAVLAASSSTILPSVYQAVPLG